MKTTMATLFAALIFLATPLLATAHGGDRHNDGPRQTSGWAKDHHVAGQSYNDHHYQERPAKRHFKKHQRQHRHFVRHHQPYRNAGPAVIVRVPRIVFNIDW